MILFHGSNVAVKEPHLLKGQRNLDFGKGFYTTSDFEQAAAWARRKTMLRGSGTPIVTYYNVNENDLLQLKTLRFLKADRAWLDYITSYRKGFALPDDYELIIGPVANDQTTQTLTLYLDGYLDAEGALKRLLTQRLKDQYTFRTAAGIALLRFCEEKNV
ncbi:MAG: DUF3990 domain-containing protein [Clostridia bacterium]|nr:DUF3990 domain-containing protein [Clostridia bacterium]